MMDLQTGRNKFIFDIDLWMWRKIIKMNCFGFCKNLYFEKDGEKELMIFEFF